MYSRTRLDSFNPRLGLDRQRSKIVEISWYFLKIIFFLSSFPWPYSLKTLLLRLFGANVGQGLVIKPRVNIHFPWKLSIADHVWIGEEVFILNLEPVTIGAHSCISQRSFLCTGNHNFRDPSFGYRNFPISIGTGVWIGAGSMVCPGVTVANDAVVCAGSIVVSDVLENVICSGNPAVPKGMRWLAKIDNPQSL